MDPFRKVVKSQKEKDELLRLARAEWEAIPGELKHLVAANDEEYLGKLSDSIIVERAPFTPPRPLTSEELARQNGELMHLQLYGDRASDRYDGLPDALREVVKAQDDEALAKLTAPAKRGETLLEQLVREAIAKVQSGPSREKRGVPSLEERLLIWSEGDSDAIRFLRARIAGDLAAQRKIAGVLAVG